MRKEGHKSVNTMANDQSLDTVSSVSVVLENNNKITQVRKTGIVSEFSNEIGSLGLTGEQTIKFESRNGYEKKSPEDQIGELRNYCPMNNLTVMISINLAGFVQERTR